MTIFFIFIVIGVAFGLFYFFGRHRFSFENLLIALWAVAIAVSQWRLSPYEKPWTVKFWLVLLLFFALFCLIYKVSCRYFGRQLKEKNTEWGTAREGLVFVLLLLMTLASIAANFYIFLRFGTLPLLSSAPDRMRFIINREIFGPWEYLALWPRIFIPLTVIYLLAAPNKKWRTKILAGLNIALGFVILSFYASRLIIVIVILLTYFSYLIFSVKKIRLKAIIWASAIAVMAVLAISTAIPAMRQYITYRDYYSGTEYSPFTYIVDLSQIKIPQNLRFLTPIYLIPSFNLQAMMRATDYFNAANFHHGQYSASAFNHVLKIFHFPESPVEISWQDLFLPWWVTATFLFGCWADFGYLGIILAAIFWGVLLAFIYNLAIKKPSFISVLLFAYFSFVVIMSIYTNYFMRLEMYLDLIVIVVVGYLMTKKKSGLIA